MRDGVVSGVKDTGEQVQPAGVDLTVERIEAFVTRPSFSPNSHAPANTKEAPRRGLTYLLRPGSYRLVFSERIKIPGRCCGLVLPRSSLLRSGLTVHTALWDPGYEGKGRVLLSVLNRRGATLSIGSRVAQLVVFRLSAAPHKTYSGRYQREGP